jgi:hypothetical protein
MQSFLSVIGSLSGLAGAAICVTAGGMRVTGAFEIGGFELGTLFHVGVGLLVAACWLKLESVERLP